MIIEKLEDKASRLAGCLRTQMTEQGNPYATVRAVGSQKLLRKIAAASANQGVQLGEIENKGGQICAKVRGT